MDETSSGGPGSVRERILVATLEVIATEGLDAVRHRRVAEIAGVSPGSTTYHFASRGDLVEEAFTYYLDEASAVLDSLAEPISEGDDPVEALVRYITALLTREFRTAGLVQAEYELILHATRSPELARRLADWEDAHVVRFEQFLRSAGAAHAQESARLLVAVIRGLEVDGLIHPGRGEDLAEQLTPVVAALVAADRAPIDRAPTD
jgi:DNA-binding transcriptional regulator YbjK